MTKHKTENYKNSAVKYYLNNDNGDGYKRTCKIFDCKKSTLRDWIKKYQKYKDLIRLDTTTLVHLLLRKKQGNKSFYTTNGNLKRNEDKIWIFFFRTERKCFTKTGFSFHHKRPHLVEKQKPKINDEENDKYKSVKKQKPTGDISEQFHVI